MLFFVEVNKAQGKALRQRGGLGLLKAPSFLANEMGVDFHNTATRNFRDAQHLRTPLQKNSKTLAVAILLH